MGTVYGGPAAANMPPQANTVALATAEAKCKKLAGWILAIAIFSTINAVMCLANVDFMFLFGMAITYFVAGLATGTGHGNVVGFVFGLLAAVAFGGLWMQAKKAATWAYVVAMVLYLGDLGILGLSLALAPATADEATAGLVKMVIFHIIALICLIMGTVAAVKVNRLRAQMQTAVPGVISTSAGA